MTWPKLLAAAAVATQRENEIEGDNVESEFLWHVGWSGLPNGTIRGDNEEVARKFEAFQAKLTRMGLYMKTDPDWSALPPETPSAIRRLLRRCLEPGRLLMPNTRV
jgi:hypothetical protein